MWYAAGASPSPIGTSFATFPGLTTWELGVSSRAPRARHSSRTIEGLEAAWPPPVKLDFRLCGIFGATWTALHLRIGFTQW